MRWGVLQYVAVFSTVVGLGVAFPAVKTGGLGAAQPVPSNARSTSTDISNVPTFDGAQPQFSGRARVIDGDTLALGDVKIRLHGIDAPELQQVCSDMHGGTWTCGQWSKAVLSRLATAVVRCVQKDIDRYDRIVGVCFVNDTDLNAAMVAKGAAFAYVKYARDYAAYETHARRTAVGLWRSGAQTPSQFRADKRANVQSKRAAVQTSGPQGCTIKGNISKSGRLYHLPGSRWYAGTRINLAQGEQWFCSEGDAKAAGWRAARG